MSDEQFKSVLDNIKKDNNIEDDAKFQEALKQEGMTLADLRRQLERTCSKRACSRTRCSPRSASPKTRRTHTTTRTSDEFTTPSELMLREILIAVPPRDRGVNVAEDDAAKAKAEDIRHRLLGGEPFARLAARGVRRAVEGQRRI